MAKENVRVAGVGFPGLLTITFIVLKLTGVIAWSWVWVLAPMWIGLVIGLLMLVGFLIVTLIILMKKNNN